MRDADVYVNLRVLSQLQPGDRIRADSTFIEIEPRGALTFVRRWVRSDTREKTVSRIEQLVQEALRISVDRDVLTRACTGVGVLIDSTYAGDPLTVARLETAINRVGPSSQPPHLLGARPWLSATLAGARAESRIGRQVAPAGPSLTKSCPALFQS